MSSESSNSFLASSDFPKPVEAVLSLHENAARNGCPSVLVNGADPGRPVMVDPMVYQIVVARPVRGPVIVNLGSPYEGSEIRYTLNGNNPTNTSHLFAGPLVFKTNATGGHTCLKARIYDRRNSNLKGKTIRVALRILVPE